MKYEAFFFKNNFVLFSVLDNKIYIVLHFHGNLVNLNDELSEI